MRTPRLLVLPAICAAALAQLPPPQTFSSKTFPTAAPGKEQSVYVTVTGPEDAAGALAESDFLLLQDDKPLKLRAAAFVDTRAERTLIFVIDDLGLSPAGFARARTAVRQFVESQLLPADRIAVLATGGGTGAREQFTSDKARLIDALEHIVFLPESVVEAGHERFAYGTIPRLRMILQGLARIPGRKSLIFLSENLYAASLPATPAGQPASGFESLRKFAELAGVAIYADGVGAPAALAALVRGSGGALAAIGGPTAAVALAIKDQPGYYRLDFDADAAPPNLTVKIRRPGFTARAGYPFTRDQASEDEYIFVLRPADELRRASVSPFLTGGIALDAAPLFEGSPPDRPMIRTFLHVNVEDISFTEDLKGVRYGTLSLAVFTFDSNLQALDQTASSVAYPLHPADYELARQNGITFQVPLHIRRSRAVQFGAIVRDETSGRMGSVVRFLSLPHTEDGALALSGITLNPGAWRGGELESALVQPSANPALRVFRRGAKFDYRYSVFNLTSDAAGKGKADAQTRLYRDGQLISEGRPLPLEFTGPGPQERRVNGSVTLSAGMSPGMYVLQIWVTDMLAPAGKPRRATRYTTFEVRP